MIMRLIRLKMDPYQRMQMLISQKIKPCRITTLEKIESGYALFKFNNKPNIHNHIVKLGLFQSNLVLVIGMILLMPFNNFSETS